MNYWAHEAGRVAGFDVTCLDLFPMPNLDDVPGHLLEADVVWVNGGSVANLLAVWDVHDLRPAMRAAWEAGVVLGGVSAGSICWYLGGTTDSFGPELRAVTNGLGLLPYGSGVHYDSEEARRPTVHRLVADGTLPETHCTDDGVGLVYRGTELVEAVSEVDGKARLPRHPRRRRVTTACARSASSPAASPPPDPSTPTHRGRSGREVGDRNSRMPSERGLHGHDPLSRRRDAGGVDDGEGVHGIPRVHRHRGLRVVRRQRRGHRAVEVGLPAGRPAPPARASHRGRASRCARRRRRPGRSTRAPRR